MSRRLKKITLVLILSVFLFVLSGCDLINNLINNISGNNNTQPPVEEVIELAKVTFDYNLEDYENFSISIKKGERIYEPIEPIISGYIFRGWYLNSTPYNFQNVINNDTTIVASWEIGDPNPPLEENVLVTYNYNMPGINLAVIKVNKGSKTIEPLAPERINYRFLGWYLNNELFDFDTNLNDSITLKAEWVEEIIEPVVPDVSVSFDFDNGTSPISIKIESGTKVIEPKSPTKEGYTFVGWFKNILDTVPYNFQAHLTTDLSLIAKYEESGLEPPDPDPVIEDVLIQFNYNVTNVDDAQIMIVKGTKVLEPKVILNEGYTFVGWFKNITDTEPYNFDEPVNNDLGLIAKWIVAEPPAPIIETVVVTFNHNVPNIENEQVTIEKGTKVIELRATERAGYTFVGWFKNIEDTIPYNFNDLVNNDLGLIAKWEVEEPDPLEPTETVVVTFNYNVPNVNPEQVSIEKGTKVLEPKIIEHEGYTFVGWFKNILDTIPYNFNAPVNSDLSLEAKWDSVPYTPTYVDVTFIDQDEDNNIIIDVVVVEKGDTMTAPTPPERSYYDFVGWVEDGSTTIFNFLNPINREYIFVAKWQLKSGTVRVSFMEKIGDTEPIESNLIALGSCATPPTLPEDPNNYFVGWTDINGVFFDFSTPIFELTILYAKYYPNYIDSINNISKNIMRGNVKIYKSLYNSLSPLATPIINTIGSGSIVKKVGDDYYILTNSHVISKWYKVDEENYAEAPYAKYEIEDYMGTKYTGTVVIDGQDGISGVDHDLAIIKFNLPENPDNNNLNIIPISNAFDEDTTQVLTAVGNPARQLNTITYGNFLNRGISSVKTVDGTTKEYSRFMISTPGAGGSSGSMVVDQNFEIVCVIFAGGAGVGFLESTYMLAVPLEYVHMIMDELAAITGTGYLPDLPFVGEFLWA